MAKEKTVKKPVPNAEAKAPEARKERAPPGRGMVFTLAALVIILIAAAAYFYLQQGEKEISLSDFRTLMASTQNVVVVQDLRTVPEGDDASRQNLQNCGVQATFILAYLGKNVTTYAYEGNSCWGGPANSTPAQCDALLKADGRYPIIISFSNGEGKTKFYTSHAAYSGNAAFLVDCAISKLMH